MGNKAILMSIQPQYVAKILNGEKTIEVRKRFPKDYVGWVYIYCTKAMPNAHIWTMKVKEKPYKVIFSKTQYQQETDLDEFMNVEFIEKYPQYAGERIICHPEHINGYVVARFWCNDVSEIVMGICPRTRNMPREDQEDELQTIDFEEKELCEKACLTEEELYNYFNDIFEKSNNWWNETFGYAIHISKLEIFDKPKEIKEFYRCCDEFKDCLDCKKYTGNKNNPNCRRITKAPQSYMFVEGE